MRAYKMTFLMKKYKSLDGGKLKEIYMIVYPLYGWRNSLSIRRLKETTKKNFDKNSNFCISNTLQTK